MIIQQITGGAQLKIIQWHEAIWKNLFTALKNHLTRSFK